MTQQRKGDRGSERSDSLSTAQIARCPPNRAGVCQVLISNTEHRRLKFHHTAPQTRILVFRQHTSYRSP